MSLIRQVTLQDPNDKTRLAKFDSLSKVFVMMNAPHHQVHNGNHFETHVNSEFGTVASLAFAFKVEAGVKRPHMVIDWTVTDKALIELIEGPTWDTNTGTVLVPINNNRSFIKTSILQEDKTATPNWTSNGVLVNPANIIGGIVLHSHYAYLSRSVGGSSSLPRHEWVLAPGQTYVIRMIKDTANCYMGIIPHWYEHIDE